MKLKQLFCSHKYRKVAHRTNLLYGNDGGMGCSCEGFYDDILYRCDKCGKEKIKTVMNNKHPLYSEWKRVDDE